ncbi:MAG TPA: hypothetical protein VFQ91_11365 [Bryobacteraceae bacterium]|nr:hypothetical protein [Bryobacteraceae bacterium]
MSDFGSKIAPEGFDSAWAVEPLIAQWCLPSRRQQAGSLDSGLATSSGFAKPRLVISNSKTA